MMKRFLFFLVIIYCSGGRAVGQTQEREANLKAVFIYNFTKYIEWDSSSVQRDFVIGVIGNSPVTRSLYQIAAANTVKNKKITIRTFSNPQAIEGCHILFIPRQIPYSLPSILEKVDRNILTVSEEPGYARQGTAFNFVIINDKLKFEANLKSIYLAGLRAGAQLLKLAIIID